MKAGCSSALELVGIDLWVVPPLSSVKVFWDAAECRAESLQQWHASSWHGMCDFIWLILLLALKGLIITEINACDCYCETPR